MLYGPLSTERIERVETQVLDARDGLRTLHAHIKAYLDDRENQGESRAFQALASYNSASLRDYVGTMRIAVLGLLDAAEKILDETQTNFTYRVF